MKTEHVGEIYRRWDEERPPNFTATVKGEIVGLIGGLYWDYRWRGERYANGYPIYLTPIDEVKND